QLNRATNRHAPKPSFGLSSGGLKRFIEGSRPRTEPRKHPKWPPGRWTVSVIRQQPWKNANFASADLSKDRNRSETSARNRVKIDSCTEFTSDPSFAFLKKAPKLESLGIDCFFDRFAGEVIGRSVVGPDGAGGGPGTMVLWKPAAREVARESLQT